MSLTIQPIHSHCERSEAIQSRTIWIAAPPAAPRNDWESEQ